MFNFNHLYYFYMTARRDGVTNAAKSLRISQPSLSAQIKSLERELNLQLFKKVGRRLALTPDGERTFGFCRKMFEAAEEFSDLLKQSGASKTERCRIGVSPEIERPFIADILTTLLGRKAPTEQPLLSLLSDENVGLLERLRSGELDAIVTNRPAYGADVRNLAHLSMPVIAVAAPKCIKRHNRQSESPTSVIRSANLGFVLPSDHLMLRIETDLRLQKLHLRNRVVFESDILAVVVRATVEGVGVAFLPRPYIAKELHLGTLRSVGKDVPLWHHSVFLVARNAKHSNPILREVRDHFVSLGGAASTG